jgi:GDPmannose 4,6-dehydratase
VRDWGYAAEYVEGMWRMMQTDEPSDYVLATGKSYSVRQFLEAAFDHADLDWREYVHFDETYLRPTEVDVVVGDSRKAQRELQWTPTLDGLDLARLMVDADLEGERRAGRWVDSARIAAWRAMEPC